MCVVGCEGIGGEGLAWRVWDGEWGAGGVGELVDGAGCGVNGWV